MRNVHFRFLFTTQELPTSTNGVTLKRAFSHFAIVTKEEQRRNQCDNIKFDLKNNKRCHQLLRNLFERQGEMGLRVFFDAHQEKRKTKNKNCYGMIIT